MSRDPIFQSFLAAQYERGMTLAGESDLLELEPLGESPPNRYIARFRCKGLVRSTSGEITEADRFEVGIWFPSDYLRRANPAQVLTWLGPRQVYHPNIADDLPLVCVGRLYPGTELVDILFQLFEMITYAKVTMREDDALNREACAWARANQHRFPIDRRPLRRRKRRLQPTVEVRRSEVGET